MLIFTQSWGHAGQRWSTLRPETHTSEDLYYIQSVTTCTPCCETAQMTSFRPFFPPYKIISSPLMTDGRTNDRVLFLHWATAVSMRTEITPAYVLRAVPGSTQAVLCQYYMTWLLQRPANVIIMSLSSFIRQCGYQIDTEAFMTHSRGPAFFHEGTKYTNVYTAFMCMCVCSTVFPLLILKALCTMTFFLTSQQEDP